MKVFKVGILLGQSGNSFWTKMKQAYDKCASEFGIDPAYAWPVSGREEETQLSALEKMLTAGYDALIVNPLNRNNLVPGILKAAARHIPVLDVGAKTAPESVKAAEPYYVPVKTVDFYLQGILGATYIIDRLKLSGGGTVAIIEGNPDSTQSIERSRGAAETFAQVPEIRIAASLPADFDRIRAADVSIRLFEQYPDLSAVFCANDCMALGVSQTVQEMALCHPVIIVGVDLIQEAVQAVQAGTMSASVTFSVLDVAKMLLDTAKKTLNGQGPPSACFPIISQLIDKRSINSIRELDDGNREN